MKETIDKIMASILLGLFWLFGKIPYGVQLAVGDVLYVVLYRVFRYRVNVTRDNLKNAFPEKPEEERRRIERKFYRHLGELFIQTISIAGVTEKQFLKRMTYTNREEYEKELEGQSSLLAMSHFGTWEYESNYQMRSDRKIMPAYHPLSNKVMDIVYYKLRSRFGTEPVSRNEVAKTVIKNIRSGIPTTFVLIADQTPPAHTKHWMTFLHQDTAFYMGLEKLSLKFGLPVHFLHVKQLRRGYYEATFLPLWDGTEEVAEFEITERYARMLEEMIRENPHLWMWSHRRWKHKKREKAS